MAADTFSWLHLTDLHFGLSGQRHLWPNLRAPFLDDLALLHERTGPWDAVFFTGDLVQSGKSAEFKDMQTEVLGRLWEKLTALGSGDAALLAVPGNHDLYRPDLKNNPAAKWLVKDFADVEAEFWDEPTGIYRRVITDAFAAYTEWWHKAPHRPEAITHGILPGDFAATLPRGTRRIGVVGLNTAFLQLAGGDYLNRLAWDARQLDAVCNGAVDDWQARHDICLLLTHHGPDWLTPAARAHGDTEIAPPGRFALHLYGHMHETDITYERRGGSVRSTRRCQGSSVFGMEHHGEPPTLHRAHGYLAGRVTLTDDATTLRLWPRRATNKLGPWRFVPDHDHADLARDDGTPDEAISSTRPPIPSRPPPPSPTLAPGPRSNLPGRRPFFGRTEPLATLASWLHPTDRSWGLLLDGPGGMGKTALALEAAHRAPAEHFPLKLWVTAKTRELYPDGERPIDEKRPTDLHALLDELARALGRDDIPRTSPDERGNALRHALTEHRALLVIDNLETLPPTERRRVMQWLNRLPDTCRAIVTSRRRDDSLGGRVLRVDKLERDAADALLTELGQRQPPVARLTADERTQLYEETGGNPLLLTWIAGQLGRTTGRCGTVDEAVARLQAAHRSTSDPDNDPLAYIFGDLVETFTPGETAVLAALVHFTRPAPVDWLLPMTTLSTKATEVALDGLRDRALLVEDEAAATWLLPPLAARFLRGVRPGAVGEAGERLAAHATALVMMNGYDQHARFPALETAWPQVEAALPLLVEGDNRRLQWVADALRTFLNFTGRWDQRIALCAAAERRAMQVDDLGAAGWRALDAGWSHVMRGEAEPVLACAGRAAAHWHSVGASADQQAAVLALRAEGHHLLGESAAALAALEEALDLSRSASSESVGVAATLINLAGTLGALGHLDDAASRNHEALALAHRRGYPETVTLATGNLAELALDREQWSAAEALAREALALAEPLGRRELIASNCNCLARALTAQGRGPEGRCHAERALEIYTALRSPDLPLAQATLAACTAPPRATPITTPDPANP